jgi:AcrR family transcriptional regulator
VAKQARSEHTRSHLVRSAAELFDRNGFAGATLDDVSRAAGVTKGAFYFHFASKNELGGAIQAEACAMLRSFVDTLTAAETSPLQSLIDITHELAGWLGSAAVIRASLRTARECGDRGMPFVAFYNDLLATVEATVGRAKAAGELADGASVPTVSTTVLTQCLGFELLWWAGARRGDLRESLTDTWLLLLPGMARPERLATLRAGGSGPSRNGVRCG